MALMLAADGGDGGGRRRTNGRTSGRAGGSSDDGDGSSSSGGEGMSKQASDDESFVWTVVVAHRWTTTIDAASRHVRGHKQPATSSRPTTLSARARRSLDKLSSGPIGARIIPTPTFNTRPPRNSCDATQIERAQIERRRVTMEGAREATRGERRRQRRRAATRAC